MCFLVYYVFRGESMWMLKNYFNYLKEIEKVPGIVNQANEINVYSQRLFEQLVKADKFSVSEFENMFMCVKELREDKNKLKSCMYECGVAVVARIILRTTVITILNIISLILVFSPSFVIVPVLFTFLNVVFIVDGAVSMKKYANKNAEAEKLFKNTDAFIESCNIIIRNKLNELGQTVIKKVEKTKIKVLAETFIMEYLNTGNIISVNPEVYDMAKLMLQQELASEETDLSVLLRQLMLKDASIGLDGVLSRVRTKE